MLTVTNPEQFTIQRFLVDSAGGVEVLLLPETMVPCISCATSSIALTLLRSPGMILMRVMIFFCNRGYQQNRTVYDYYRAEYYMEYDVIHKMMSTT